MTYKPDADSELGLWNEEEGFYFDAIQWGTSSQQLPIRSLVGLIPLYATLTLEPGTINRFPGFKKRMEWFMDNRSEMSKRNMANMKVPGKGKLKGAIILLRKPADMSKLDPNPENAYDAVITPQHGVRKEEMGWRERLGLLRQLAAEEPALLVMDSGKTDSLYNMTGGYPAYSPTQVPMAFLTGDAFSFEARFIKITAVQTNFRA